ncbi:hypothetical protein B0H13DRAFT_1889759 [Mycena leptocephala]|nr:hypothetical protein B0H13DRAFT_1889759 [Mycena leptocephala]
MYWSNDDKKEDQSSKHGSRCGQKAVTADPGKWFAALFACSTYPADSGASISGSRTNCCSPARNVDQSILQLNVDELELAAVQSEVLHGRRIARVPYLQKEKSGNAGNELISTGV